MLIQPEVEADRSMRNAWNLAVGSDMCSNVQEGLEKRVWMEYGQNTTYVKYTLAATDGVKEQVPITITLSSFCAYRSYHASTHGGSGKSLPHPRI